MSGRPQADLSFNAARRDAAIVELRNVMPASIELEPVNLIGIQVTFHPNEDHAIPFNAEPFEVTLYGHAVSGSFEDTMRYVIDNIMVHMASHFIMQGRREEKARVKDVMVGLLELDEE